MYFWLIVLGSTFLAAAGCGFYLVTGILKFSLLNKLKSTNKAMAVIIAIAVLVVLTAVCVVCIGAMNTIISVIHLAVFWAVCDFGAAVIRKFGAAAGNTSKAAASGPVASGPYYAGICAIALTVIYLAIAWILAHNITPTVYAIETEKDVGSLRIIQFADAHIGTTFDADGFERAVAGMQEYNPDVVVITGDFVDDSTTEENFVRCCEALGRLKTKYGIYYVFGNHDKSYRSTIMDMAAEGLGGVGKNGAQRVIDELTKNEITVLQDESVLIDGRFYIVGRQDYNRESRASMNSLISETDTDKYIVVLDHQPRDYDAQAAAGADLVLSGHTHGGQMIPLAPLVRILGSNDLVYGHEKRGTTDFIVTSGISDWEIKFKTGCRSEFVVIDINSD